MIKNLPFPSIFISILIVLGSFTQALSQDWMFDVGMIYGRQLDEFRTEGYKDGIGFTTGLYSPLLMADNGLVGLRLGARGDFEFAGRSKGNMIAQIPNSSEFGEMHLENSSISMLGVFRLESTPTLPIQMYLEGLAGARRGVTSEVFNDHDDWEEDECIDANVLTSWNLAYGAAAGTLIRLNQSTRLNLRVSYTTSRPVDFVDLSTAAQVENNLYDFQQKIAPATQLQIQAGVSFDIDARCAPSRGSLSGAEREGYVSRGSGSGW